ncbi:MAG: hypothetical protein IJS26_06735 [Alphaproteobacteria bacterium]|nr:hypothetical protein [Alphaproteobacteria bacterium]
MNKQLDLKQFFVGTLSFVAHNVLILVLFGAASFLASFLSLKYVFGHQNVMLVCYALFCYAFYFVFISLYYEQKPLITSEKIVSSVLKIAVVFALSFLGVMLFKALIMLLRYGADNLVGLSGLYAFLRRGYVFLSAYQAGRFLLYLPIMFMLMFTFFIPGFTFVSSLNGKDASILGAYEKTHGQFLKIFVVLVCLYALLPMAASLVVAQKPVWLGVSHAVLTMFQLVCYVRLYDFFYQD